MASMVAAAATDDSDRRPLRLDSLQVVDLSLLSQSDLYSLSLSSDSAFDLNRRDDVVIPKINRAIFNESAGSRKQTYSRFRLASAESTKTATLHRRTPHIRPSLTHSSNSINDPEQAENSQIIRVLKQLCKSDPNFQDIDQIEEEHNSDCNSVLPEILNTETLSIKRKRGRPRKHENVIFLRPPTDKRLRNHTVKKEIVYDIEKDREIENDRGVAVNTAMLAGLEDPYGPEIRKRTTGMLTEDQLLGFLRGLDGQWGSRRRKRRMVDASEFGDALPKGWKLSLCIKKKEGRCWLYCRRYLSPSGQQFESCKEISTYLMSIFGEEKLNNQNPVHINHFDDFALKEASGNVAEPVLQDDIKRDGPVENLSPSLSPSPSPSPSSSQSPPPVALPAVPENCKEQVNLDVQVNDDVSNDLKKTEPSLALESDQQNTVLLSAGDDVVVETDHAHFGDKVNICKESNPDELVHDLNIVSHRNNPTEESLDKLSQIETMNDEGSRTDQVPEAAVSESELIGDKVPLPISEGTNTEREPSVEIHVDNGPDFNFDQGLNSNEQTCSPTDQVVGLDNISETQASGTLVSYVDSAHNKSECILHEQMAGGGAVNPPASEAALVKNASICGEKGFDPTIDMDIDIDLDTDINNTSDQMISGKEKVVGELSSGFFLGRFGLDQDGASAVKGVNVNKLSSGSTSSRLNGPFDDETTAFRSYGASSRMQGASAFQEENELNKNPGNDLSFSTMDKEPNKSEEVKVDDFNIFGNNEPKRNESEDVLDFNTKSSLEFCSLVPCENEQEFGFQDCLYDNTMDECKEESSERGLLNHFTDDIFENKMYSTPLDGLKFDDDRDLSRNELSLAFGGPNVPSKIEEAFDVHTNLSMVNSSMVENRRGSVGGLFNLPGNAKTSTFQNVWDGIKSDEFKNTGNKFTTGFGTEEVVPRGMWRSADGNQLQSGLSVPSHAHIPSSSSFHSFNIMSDKGGDAHAQFRLGERYNEGYGMNGLRSNRPEPVEFSFLSARSQHPLQGDSRVFPYNTEMDPQFDSSFWLGKNSMMANPGGRNQMTGVCALCRSEYHLPPVHFGTQDAMASFCPSCSAGMSGHVNMM